MECLDDIAENRVIDTVKDDVERLRHPLGLARSRAREGGHPLISALTAYHAGSLDAEAAEEVQEHVAGCPECTDLLLDLATFVDPKTRQTGRRTVRPRSPGSASGHIFHPHRQAPPGSYHAVADLRPSLVETGLPVAVVVLEPGWIKAGSYKIRVASVVDGATIHLGSYPIEVVSP